MLPKDPHDVVKQSATFRELRLGTSSHFLMGRLLNIWSECDPGGITFVPSIHMLWLDKEGQLMEANVQCEDSAHMCRGMNIGCLYTMINPTVIPARSERRTAPSDLRLYFTDRASFKGIHENRTTMNFPDDCSHQVLFNDNGSSGSLPLCYSAHATKQLKQNHLSKITRCVTHITEPTKVNSDTAMFQIYLEDISGNKGLVSYIGTKIKEFIRSADAKEVHYPLIGTATALTRNVHAFTHIPPLCFVTSPGSRLIVHPYNEMTHTLMNRFFHNRLPVDIIDYSSKERLGYLRRKIPPRISLLELKNKVPLGEQETEAECESGNHKEKVVLNHEPALALIRMAPLEFQIMPYDQRIELLKKCCDIKFMAELYIVGSEDSDEPQIHMFAIWNPKAFQLLLDLKLRL